MESLPSLLVQLQVDCAVMAKLIDLTLVDCAVVE